MRVLKDGTVKYKASAYKEYNRLSQPIFPMPIFSKGSRVKVYMGCGWSTATVLESRQHMCVVRLSVGNRIVTVSDARSIQKAAND